MTDRYIIFMRIILVGLMSLLILGCQNDVYYHQSPSRHVVVFEGQRMSVLKLSDHNWEVAGGYEKWDEDNQSFKDRQIKAIETVSGCKVVESKQYAAENSKPSRMIAQVECGT